MPVAKKRTFSLEQITEAIHNGTGFCLGCGEESGTVEPDARAYKCESCDKSMVFGAEELVIMGRVS